ncbi:MAG TPA: GNAT family N-acetyltransferase [Vicinamibacterales bacterium]|nr:GNAT family N-acetyltransferase [Vicinamibacterales bacterium]
MATRGRLLDVSALPGFVAADGEQWLGYSTYEQRDGALEIAVIESMAQGGGVGVALLAASVAAARDGGATRVWLITTNDNTHALRFYQRRGFVLAALHRDAVTIARQSLKPEIPQQGKDDIPIRDEIELELPTHDWQAFIDTHAWPQT